MPETFNRGTVFGQGFASVMNPISNSQNAASNRMNAESMQERNRIEQGKLFRGQIEDSVKGALERLEETAKDNSRIAFSDLEGGREKGIGLQTETAKTLWKSTKELLEMGKANGLYTDAEIAVIEQEFRMAARLLDPLAEAKEKAQEAGMVAGAEAQGKYPYEIGKKREESRLGGLDRAEVYRNEQGETFTQDKHRRFWDVEGNQVTDPERLERLWKIPTTTTQNVNTRDVTSAKRKGYIEAYGKRADKYLEAADEAKLGLMNNDTSAAIIGSGIFAGRFGPTQHELAKVLSSLGLISGEGEQLIKNTETYTNSRVAATGRIINLFGAGTGLSDADRVYALQGAAGKLTQGEMSLNRTLYIDTIANMYLIKRLNDDLPEEFADLREVIPELPNWVRAEMGKKYEEGKELGLMEKWLVKRESGEVK